MKKRLSFLLTALAVVLSANAQTNGSSAQSNNRKGTDNDVPQKIVTFVKVKHTPEWYVQQAKLWRAVTEREPQNEEAWINLYHATRYSIGFNDGNEDYSPLTAVWQDMRKAVPETYADYLLTYFHAKFVGLPDTGNMADVQNQSLQNMVKAIRMRPDEVNAYPDYVACLMITGDEKLLDDILRRWYESGTYSASLLNYAYNEMAGLPDNALFFTNGDIDTYSKLLLQGGKGLFRGVKVVCIPMLFSSTYRETVCRQLGVPVMEEPKATTQEEYNDWLEQTELYLIEKTKRPAYFFVSEQVPSFIDKLYSEGLVYRYSPRRYDNLAVKQQNYEKRYLLDYLYESFVPETYEASAYRLNLNYIPCLKSLLDWYKQNDKARYKELYGMMMTILRRTEQISDEKRQSYYDEINR